MIFSIRRECPRTGKWDVTAWAHTREEAEKMVEDLQEDLPHYKWWWTADEHTMKPAVMKGGHHDGILFAVAVHDVTGRPATRGHTYNDPWPCVYKYLGDVDKHGRLVYECTSELKPTLLSRILDCWKDWR